jgi:feruloyl esterase
MRAGTVGGRGLKTILAGAALACLFAGRAVAAVDCAGLASLGLKDVRVVSATLVSPGSGPAPAPNGRPVPVKTPFCRVQGVIETEIGFELWLPDPAAWNRRFLAGGVGGQAGQFNTAELARGAARGYASASTDSGHKAADTHWLLGDPMRAQNYAHRANHLLAVKSREIIDRYYARPVEHAFFVGCSGGGRQALTELQRYPEDFDGVIAGAPGPKTPEMSARRMWEMLQHTSLAGVMTEADWTRLAQAAVRRCDRNDDVADGVIENPMACRFDPGELACRKGATTDCLNPTQLAAVRRIYGPLRDEAGKKIDDGLLPGVVVSPVPAPEPFTPGPAYLATVLFGDGVHHDANWDSKSFRLASDLPAVDAVMNLHADDPDIRAFKARGGKLILYQGWADPLVSAHQTIDYYKAVRATLGGGEADRFIRLFMVPGMGHCVGGPAPDQFGGAGGDAPTLDPGHDMLSALEQWVQGGPAPSQLIAAKLDAGRAVIRTRPLCAWPAVARYKGRGDTDRAENFTCKAPA